MTTSTIFRGAPELPALLIRYRRILTALLHLALIWAANFAAFWLRFDGDIPEWAWLLHRQMLPWLLLIRGVTFLPFRLYEGLWRYTGLWDLRNIVYAIGSSSLLFFVLDRFLIGSINFPRSVYIIDALLLLCFTSGARLTKRILAEMARDGVGKRVVIYGAGDAGEMIVRDMRTKGGHNYRAVAFVDDDASKVGEHIHGVPVLGSGAELPRIIARLNPDEILVAIPRADPGVFRNVVRNLQSYNIPIKTLPNLREILDNKVEIDQIRNVSVRDLLSRGAIDLDLAPTRRLLAGRRVMVTGAGGSIGSELCRQIASFKPSALILFDHSEIGLFHIGHELIDRGDTKIHSLIGDITDRQRVNQVLVSLKPEIVFHAAAHKHVPIMEENPCEAVKNNVGGTRVLAEACEEHGVDRFVLISTDKAVNPTGVMGATKRVAELLLQTQDLESGTTFITVRFGNVLGSSGSVVPRFLQQIKAGGPVTVTHPEVRRFFMLIPEAVQLVLHAAGGEGGRLYVLEMGEQVKLADMARDLIRLAGYLPSEIPVAFIGLRPGEKMFEELVGDDEIIEPSPAENLVSVRAVNTPDRQTIAAQVARLEATAAIGDSSGVLQQLGEIVPSYERRFAHLEALSKQSTALDMTPVMAASERESVKAIGLNCPRCGSNSVRLSQTKTRFEHLRRSMTNKRPFRCQDCRWRGWATPMAEWPRETALDVAAMLDPDLTAVDQSVMDASSVTRPIFSPRDLRIPAQDTNVRRD